MEYANCNRDYNNSNVKDDAYRIEWNGKIGKKGYYSVSKFYANPDYYGYYQDSDYSNASLVYSFTPHLQGHISYNKYENNLDLRPTDPTAERETYWQAGANYTLKHNYYLSIDLENFVCRR